MLRAADSTLDVKQLLTSDMLNDTQLPGDLVQINSYTVYLLSDMQELINGIESAKNQLDSPLIDMLTRVSPILFVIALGTSLAELSTENLKRKLEFHS